MRLALGVALGLVVVAGAMASMTAAQVRLDPSGSVAGGPAPAPSAVATPPLEAPAPPVFAAPAATPSPLAPAAPAVAPRPAPIPSLPAVRPVPVPLWPAPHHRNR